MEQSATRRSGNRGEAAQRGPQVDGRLAVSVKLAYAAPTFALSGMAVPIYIYMNKFYADVVLVPLGYLALAVALARAFDALTDPFMGWLSDRTRSRWGRRRPYMAIGAPACGLAFFALFSPPAGFGIPANVTWFATTFLLFFTCHTIFSIPYGALGAELSLDYHERSTLFGWRESFALAGTLSAAVAPGALYAWLGSERVAYTTLSAGYGVLLAILGILAAIRLRERPEFGSRPSNPFVPGVRRALRNRPFRILLGSYVVGSITAAIPGTLLPFYIAYVIRPDAVVFWTTTGIAAHFATALVSIPGWLAISRRVGKRSAWLTSFGMSIFSLGGTFFLGTGDVAIGILLFAWAGVSFGGQILLTPSIQADVIDYDELHTGRRREAQYGALWTLLPKLVAIPGAAIPLAVIGALGYVPNAAQSAEVVLAIRVLIGLVPAGFALISLWIATRFPITEPVHDAIREGIARHARGEAATDPLSGVRLLPARLRSVDESTSWLLDHFSRGELRRASRGGVGSLRRAASWATAACFGTCAGSIALALRWIKNSEQAPGALPVIAIATAGISLAAGVFHAIRVRAVREVGGVDSSPSGLQRHLDESAPSRKTTARKP